MHSNQARSTSKRRYKITQVFARLFRSSGDWGGRKGGGDHAEAPELGTEGDDTDPSLADVFPLLRRIRLEDLPVLFAPQRGACLSILMDLPMDDPDFLSRLSNIQNRIREFFQRLDDQVTPAHRKSLKSIEVRLASLSCRRAGIFISESVAGFLPVHFDGPEHVSVGERFHLDPVLPLAKKEFRYFVLSVKRTEFRLYLGTLISLERIRQYPLADGFSEMDRRIQQDMKALADGAPLLIVGLTEIRQEFQKLCTYPNRIDSGLSVTSDTHSLPELHRITWEQVGSLERRL